MYVAIKKYFYINKNIGTIYNILKIKMIIDWMILLWLCESEK